MGHLFGKTEPTIYGFSAVVVFLCGCGNPAPITMPYMPGMAGLATCPKCKSKISIGGFTWQVGDPFPSVQLVVTKPSVIIPATNVLQKS